MSRSRDNCPARGEATGAKGPYGQVCGVSKRLFNGTDCMPFMPGGFVIGGLIGMLLTHGALGFLLVMVCGYVGLGIGSVFKR